MVGRAIRVLLSSYGKDLHEFIELDNPPAIIKLPVLSRPPDMKKPANEETYTEEELSQMVVENESVIFIRIGYLDGIAIYVEKEH